MKSRYRGPARPPGEYKAWLLEGYNANSWSRNQSEPPPIYLRPDTPYVPESPDSDSPYYQYIDSQGYPFDLSTLNKSINLAANPESTTYELT